MPLRVVFFLFSRVTRVLAAAGAFGVQKPLRYLDGAAGLRIELTRGDSNQIQNDRARNILRYEAMTLL